MSIRTEAQAANLRTGAEVVEAIGERFDPPSIYRVTDGCPDHWLGLPHLDEIRTGVNVAAVGVVGLALSVGHKAISSRYQRHPMVWHRSGEVLMWTATTSSQPPDFMADASVRVFGIGADDMLYLSDPDSFLVDEDEGWAGALRALADGASVTDVVDR